MQTKLHILLLEDDLADAELIAQELEAAGFYFRLTRIQTEEELRRSLSADPPDLILSDHGLPSFSGFKALKIVRDTSPDLPFIFVSGSNDQGMVVQMHELGATDYVYKNDVADLAVAVGLALGIQRNPAPANPPPSKPAPAAVKPGNFSALTRLWFCPECLQARDESNAMVHLRNYFQGHAEVMVIRERCTLCGQLQPG
jgi:CheY-like chemotaxis protein